MPLEPASDVCVRSEVPPRREVGVRYIMRRAVGTDREERCHGSTISHDARRKRPRGSRMGPVISAAPIPLAERGTGRNATGLLRQTKLRPSAAQFAAEVSRAPSEIV